MRRYRNVPPLQFLLGFEAAARLGSFSKAAAELGLSQSAVSHEMRLLEERIGQPLFLRVGRSIQLTDAGHVYQRTVREALNDLDAAQQRLEPFRRKSSVVIYAPRDFGRSPGCCRAFRPFALLTRTFNRGWIRAARR